MPLVLYNTLSKREEEFHPRVDKRVTMYTCGPTVYGRPHIGNYSSFLMADLLRRWLEISGYTVIHVKNITDVGHLVADQDQGEDKIEKQAKEERLDPLNIAAKYTEQYLDDEHALNLLEPYARPRATETIPEMLDIIRTLLANGHAYETDDGVYFAVTTFPEYGKLSGNRLQDLEAGARIDVDEKKKHPADFALWKKTVGDNAHHVLRWSFATGERVHTEGDDPSAGFPGWHIECSAMARKILGPQIDIHTGGEDNIFPHHECEIAQSECSGPKPFVKYWLHKRRIEIALEGEMSVKMSKSLGNVLTLSDLAERGFDPMDVRYYLLSVHYRTNLKFSWKGLEDAKKARRKIVEWIKAMSEGDLQASRLEGSEALRAHAEEFTRAMNQDLNTSGALAAVFEMMTASRSITLTDGDRALLQSFIAQVRQTFGCFEPEEEQTLPEEVASLVAERHSARERKDFAESDRLRAEIESRGYAVRDTAEGQVVKQAK